MIHTDSRWTYTQEHMDNLRYIQKGKGSFGYTLIEAWFLAGDDNKKQLEKSFLFLSDPKNLVTEKEYNSN